jgi:hypothetical protein
VKGIQVCSNKGPDPLHRGDNHKNVKMGWGHLRIFFLQNPSTNFNQTWHKLSVEERIQVRFFVLKKRIAPLQGEIITKE